MTAALSESGEADDRLSRRRDGAAGESAWFVEELMERRGFAPYIRLVRCADGARRAVSGTPWTGRPPTT